MDFIPILTEKDYELEKMESICEFEEIRDSLFAVPLQSVSVE